MILLAILFVLAGAASAPAQTIIEDKTFPSRVLGEERNYRVFLPPDYASTEKRYPVVYWFHGHGERHDRTPKGPGRDYDSMGYAGDTIAAYVEKHDLIVVKIDGFNPRRPGEEYVRPWNISPVETHRQFPMLFPEVVELIDRTYRTIADREHRGTAGLSMGGFMSYWVAGKYPHLVSSASNFMGSTEFSVGPRGFDVEYRHEEMRNNYAGVRTRLVMGLRDFILFYHRRLNALWRFAAPHHEWEEYDFDHGTPAMSRTLDFHMRSFANPLPKPAVFTHHDVYPNFGVWGWEVLSDLRQPGFTTLANVSPSGFRSSIREWLFEGALLPQVKMTILTPAAYPPKKPQKVTVVRTRDLSVSRETVTADAEGRLVLEINGDEYEVGIGSAPVLAIEGARLQGMEWATAGQPVKANVRFLNKGGAPSQPVNLKWITSNPRVQYETPSAAVPALEPGKYSDVPLVFTVNDPEREIVEMYATGGGLRLQLEIPLFPEAPPAKEFRLADGTNQPVYQQAVNVEQVALGNGNADGKPAPGERFAVLLRDGEAWRGAELFTNEPCLQISTRLSDVWSRYDHVGASAKTTLLWVRDTEGCEAGRTVRMLARVVIPNKPLHRLRYAVVEFPLAAKP